MSLPDASSWSKHSGSYNSQSGEPLTLPLVRSSFENLFFDELDKTIAARKGKGPLKVLCLACGTGAEISVLCSRYDETQMTVLATDFAPGMVQEVQKYIEGAGKEKMVTSKVMDAMNIQAEDASFDAVFLILGPMIMPDPPGVFTEIQRVLVVGGWSGYLTPNRMETHDVLIKARKSLLDSVNRGAEFVSFYDTDLMKNWGTPDALKTQLQAAHFDRIQSVVVESVSTLQRGEKVDEFLTRLFSNPGMSKMYTGDLSAEQGDQFRAQVRASFHANWPVSQSPTPATPYANANAAIGYKGDQ